MKTDASDQTGMVVARAHPRSLGRSVRIVLAALIVSGAVVAGSLSALAWYYGRDLPDYHKITDYQPRPGRHFVRFNALPPLLIHAFLAAEDRNFYSHPGIDVAAIARATFIDVFRVVSRERPIGASTITQQLVRRFLLSDKLTLRRKIREILLALRIERLLSKDRILELYVNTIYFGCGNWGISAAARDYFGEPVERLTLPESALIAGLPQAPHDYNPRQFPAAAKERRDTVLNLMAEDGYITAKQARAAKSTPLDPAALAPGKTC